MSTTSKPQDQHEHCPDCFRLKARSADDCLHGLCPKWYAVRDADSRKDCEEIANRIKAAYGAAPLLAPQPWMKLPLRVEPGKFGVPYIADAAGDPVCSMFSNTTPRNLERTRRGEQQAWAEFIVGRVSPAAEQAKQG